MNTFLADLGHAAVVSAFSFACGGAALALLAARLQRASWLAVSRRSAAVTFVSLTVACTALVLLILRGAFQIQYVWAHSNRALPLVFKIAALWGGQEGSLLFWSWILALYAWLALAEERGPSAAFQGYLAFVLLAVLSFFLSLNVFAANAFNEQGFSIPGGLRHPVFPEDGKGLNPLLQHPAMLIHPPVLYLGYIGWAVPFAHAMAALAARVKEPSWIGRARAWAMTAWLFQGCGILLGARWAYVELGWGGYWGWDPVENASLMPWLCGTAFLHSVMVEERRGMLKLWNRILVVLCFLAAVLGTFLTRSGVVSSVHAFAQSQIGPYFAVFLAVTAIASAALILARRDLLRPSARVESVLSRESGFLFNNVLFIALCFAVLWGTVFPVISEAVAGEQIVLGPPYFDTVTVPLALALIFLMGVGPLLAWRRSSWASLRRNFARPLALGAAAGLAAWALGARHGYALISMSLLAFVASGIAIEFYRGARAHRQARRCGWRQAVLDLIFENTRRWGGYIVHFAMVLLFLGFTGAAFNEEARFDLAAGESARFGRYELVAGGVESKATANYASERVSLALSKAGRSLGPARPERRFYPSSEQGTSEVIIRSSLTEDLYVVFAGRQEGSERAIVQLYRKPLVAWIWIGAFVMILGTFVAMTPSRRPQPAPQTGVVAERKAEELVLQ